MYAVLLPLAACRRTAAAASCSGILGAFFRVFFSPVCVRACVFDILFIVYFCFASLLFLINTFRVPAQSDNIINAYYCYVRWTRLTRCGESQSRDTAVCSRTVRSHSTTHLQVLPSDEVRFVLASGTGQEM